MFWLDTMILLVLSIGAGLGAWSGLVKQVVRVVGLIAALAASVYLHGWASDALQQSLMQGANPLAVDGLAYVAVFLGVLLAFQLTALMLEAFLKAVQLKWVDRVLGSVLGGFKAALIVGAICLVLFAFPPNQETKTALAQSRLAPVLATGADLAFRAVPSGYATSLRNNFEKVTAEAATKATQVPDAAEITPGLEEQRK
jgi:membrane protein required for colicin V production